jgi:nucleoside phosphorylase
MPFYLRPSAPTAVDAVICGDPARALAIAQHVMVQPRMSNHNRGLWGYYGETPAGMPLTVQATGIGGPSAVAVLAEAIGLGVGRVIRIGTCAGAGRTAALGSPVVLEAAIAADGTCRALGVAEGEVLPTNPAMTASLAAEAGVSPTTLTSSDLIDAAGPAGLRDLQTAAVLSLCRREAVPAAAALVVRSIDGRRLHDDPLDAALLRLAAAAVTAFGEVSASS